MEVLALTVLGSLVLAALFVVLFLSNGRTAAHEQDSLLPLADGKAPSVTPLPPLLERPAQSDITPTTHEK
ncbi:MAG: hypothetical protein O3C21_08480 [Verrucomicrobia bacterium]|nr:hypothetical protein [Verrucomicrobiota bacterium]